MSAPKPDIEICFLGKGVFPEDIPLRHVADAVGAVQHLGCTHFEDDGAGLPSVRLLKVKRGSAIYGCVSENPTDLHENVRKTGRQLEATRPSESLAPSLKSIQRLSEIAASADCSIVIRSASDRDDVLATITPETYGTLSASLLLKGTKTISGIVQRAGGATERKCALRVSFQHRLLYCDVGSEDLVRKLGQFLYQDVVVSGQVTWVRASWEVVRFVIQDVQITAPGGIKEGFLALRQAGGEIWDSIDDPKSYLREMTGN